MMKDVLSEIIAHKKIEVAERKAHLPLAKLEKEWDSIDDIPFRSMKSALENSSSGIIAEFKRRSPSKGWLHQSASAIEVAGAYESAGAAALSVLTDEKYFGGGMGDLQQAVGSVAIPVMRKEFIVDRYQLYEAKLAGASAVLLIAAAITKEECNELTGVARELELEVLLELHDEREVDYITPAHSIIGVNNRNLGSFVTDVQKSFRMIDLLPKEAVLVSESGISDPSLVRDLRSAGYKGFLIGEHFMRNGQPGATLKEFIEAINQ